MPQPQGLMKPAHSRGLTVMPPALLVVSVVVPVATSVKLTATARSRAIVDRGQERRGHSHKRHAAPLLLQQ